jgi:hypothetical protein
MVKEEKITALHAAQKIARLIIAYAIPAGLTETLQVMNR